MNTSTVAKKDITKLQRAIVDGLEDVKAQDIQVFDTEHLSALFERVIVASGTSNRQTKGLAASVRDAVREAGFDKPRIEGEENGEWIIVDCGQAVVHIMQPTFRTYYNLEELWGEKPVRLKLGASKPAMAESAKSAPKVEPTLKRSNAAKKGVAEAFPSKAQMKKDADKAAKTKAPARKSAAPKPAAKSAASSGAAAPAKKVAAKKVPVSAKRTVVGKPAAKPAAKSAAKPAAKKTAVRKA
ncbi:MAG: ribosome silencing factor [Pseudomonadota bacterium]